VARSRPEKKRIEPAVTKVLPMDLRVGDRLTDESGEWEVSRATLHDGQRQERARSRSASRPAGHHRHPDMGRTRTAGDPTRMSLLTDLQEFVRVHRPHGGMTGDATEPAWNGYLLTVTCPCGVVFERWVTPEEADVDLIGLAALN